MVTPAAVSRRTGSRGPLRRVRTVLLDPVTGQVAVDEHVRVRLTAAEDDRAQLADVLVGYGTGAPGAAEVAVAHPGALVVAVHRGDRCWIRLGPDGTVLELEAGGGAAHPEELWEGVASLAHSWLAAGRPGAALTSARVLLVHVPRPPSSSRVSRCRAARASSEPDLPTEE